MSRALTTLVVGSLVFGASEARAQAPDIELWLNDHGRYEQGDRMRVFFSTDRDAYVTVVRVDTDGRVRIVFPMNPAENNYVAGGERYEATVGDRDYRVHDTPGHGYVFAVVSAYQFDYESFVDRNTWDYHLISFVGEDERDPYDTFAHFMDDILPPETENTFSYQAASYSVDERGSRFYYSSYHWYSRPHYHNCHVYRAFVGLRGYYRYGYDCSRVGVHVVIGPFGHFHYHDYYYHYDYLYGYSPYYYYGYGSTYVYHYTSGHYRYNHGVRRVVRNVGYGGTNRHSERNSAGRAVTSRRRSVDNSGRRSVGESGSDVRRSTSARRSVNRSPTNGGSSTTSSRRTVTRSPANTGNSSSSARRSVSRRTPTARQPQARPEPRRVAPQPRTPTSGTRSSTSRRPVTRSTPSPRSSGRNVVRRTPTTRTPSVSRPRTTTRRTVTRTPTRSATPRSRPSTSRARPRSVTRSRPTVRSRPSRSSSRSRPTVRSRPSRSSSRARPSSSRGSSSRRPSGRRPNN